MRIIVPTLGRAGTAASMKWLPRTNRNIVIAAHSDEIEAYYKAYGADRIEYLELPDSCRRHTGLVRKEIMARYQESFFFVDDDIRLSLKAVASYEAAFDVLEKHMEAGVTMAGFGQQLFSNGVDTGLVNGDYFAIRNKFVATVYAIDATKFNDLALERLPVYEDVALVIHAIQYGGGTVTSYVATHSNVSPPEGGCNSWRNKANTIQSLETLVEMYPGICSIRATTNTTHSQHIGIGLRTAWSKIRKLDV